jgi:O-antigen/teichoic acid export membrane protein
MSADIESRTRRGVAWSAVTSVLGQLATFVFGIVLARLLAPEDFGYLAAIIIFVEIGSSVVSSGFVSALIQHPSVNETHYSSVMVAGLVMGITGSLILVGISPWVGELFQNGLVGQVLSVMSAYLVILPFITIPTAQLRKQLDFRSTGIVEVVQQMTTGGLSVCLAYFGWGVWSLVFGRLWGNVCLVVCLSRLARWTPRFRFDSRAFSELLPLSFNVAAANILNDISQNIGFSLIGRLLGANSLGLYHRAYYLMTLPLTRITNAVNNVLYSAFAEVQTDPHRAKRGLLKSTCYVAMVSNPILIGLLFIAPSLIHTFYGDKWMGVVPPLQILCLAGVLFAVEPLAVSLITAMGYAGFEVRRQVIYLLVMVTGVVAGSRWGLVGVAWAVVGASIVFLFLLQRLLHRLVNLSFSEYVAVMIPSFVGCAVMAGTLLTYQRLMPDAIPPLSPAMLVTSMSLGAVTYGLYVYSLGPRTNNAIAGEVINEMRQYARDALSMVMALSTGRLSLRKPRNLPC